MTAGASAEPLCTNTWTGPSEGSWRTAADWSAGNVPTSSDVACIEAGDTVDIAEGSNQAGVVQGQGALALTGGLLELTNALDASSIASLALRNATLSIAGTLSVSTSLAFGGPEPGVATVSGAGKLVVGSAVAGTINPRQCSRVVLDEVTLLNQGTITDGVSGGAPDGPISMENGAQIQNAGTFNDDSTEPAGCGIGRTASIYNAAAGATPSITNTGTFQASGGEEPIEVNVPFNNQATTAAQSGKLQLGAGGSATSGAFSAAAGAELSFTGGSFALTGGSWSGPGTIAVAGAAVTAASLQANSAHASLTSGSLTIPAGSTTSVTALSLGGGDLALPGELDTTAAFSAGGVATVSGAGKLVVGSAVAGTINPRQCSRVVLDEVTLLNQGTITDGVSGGAPDGPISMENGAQIQNAGTFNDDSTEPAGCGIGRTASIYNAAAGATPSITNTGTFQASGGEEPIEVNVPFNNQATTAGQAAKLHLGPGGSATSGAFSAAAALNCHSQVDP